MLSMRISRFKDSSEETDSLTGAPVHGGLGGLRQKSFGYNRLSSLLFFAYLSTLWCSEQVAQVLLGHDIVPPDDEALAFQVFPQAEHECAFDRMNGAQNLLRSCPAEATAELGHRS